MPGGTEHRGAALNSNARKRDASQSHQTGSNRNRSRAGSTHLAWRDPVGEPLDEAVEVATLADEICPALGGYMGLIDEADEGDLLGEQRGV